MELSARFPGKLRMMLSANPYIRYRMERGNAALEGMIELFFAYSDVKSSTEKKTVDK